MKKFSIVNLLLRPNEWIIIISLLDYEVLLSECSCIKQIYNLNLVFALHVALLPAWRLVIIRNLQRNIVWNSVETEQVWFGLCFLFKYFKSSHKQLQLSYFQLLIHDKAHSDRMREQAECVLTTSIDGYSYIYRTGGQCCRVHEFVRFASPTDFILKIVSFENVVWTPNFGKLWFNNKRVPFQTNGATQ